MNDMSETIYAFIDSQNLNLGVKSQGWRLDFARFRVFLKDKYKVDKAFLFIGYMEKHKDIYNYLTKVGYELVFKPVVEKGSLVKGNVDAELVLHAMIEYKHYHKAVIVSGDGDFRCLVEYLKNKEKLEKVIIPNRKRYSILLQEFHQDLIFLNDKKQKLEIK